MNAATASNYSAIFLKHWRPQKKTAQPKLRRFVMDEYGLQTEYFATLFEVDVARDTGFGQTIQIVF